MLTDSGGYQIFSMGHGSVGDEIKGRRAGGGVEFCELITLSEDVERAGGKRRGGKKGNPRLHLAKALSLPHRPHRDNSIMVGGHAGGLALLARESERDGTF